MVTMRSRGYAAVFAVVLGFAVILMHTGLSQGTHRHLAAAQHDGFAATVAHQHTVTVDWPTIDAIVDHQMHDCAGTVTEQQHLLAPSLLATLPIRDRSSVVTPEERAALARGPPPWTVLTLAELCLLRI